MSSGMVGRGSLLGFLTLSVVAGLLVMAPAAQAAPRCEGKKATIVGRNSTVKGTKKADVIVGTSKSQKILGGGGSDRICGGGGNDRIFGGPGNDRINGGAGNDFCTENAGVGTKQACESPLVGIAVASSGPGAGTVSSSPGGISCPPTCNAAFLEGTAVSLSTSASAGSAFGGWSGPCSGTGGCALTLNSPTTVGASFSLTSRLLSVSLSGSGSGVVSSNPAGIACGLDCAESLPFGTSVTLTATPSAGSGFSGWSGGGCSGTGSCVVTMDAARTVAAGFTANRVLTLVSAGTGSGTVASSPTGISCGVDCTETFLDGTSVTLTATPSSDSVFTSWTGCNSSSGNECVVAMSSSKSVTATFTKITYALTVSKDGSGSGTVTSSPAGIGCGATCSHSFDTGTSVTLTASADANSVFTGWTGQGCSGTGTCIVAMDGAKSVTATFTAGRTLTVGTDGGNGFGSVTSSPPGITCPSDCEHSYLDGSTVELTAAASAGSNFTSWSGCDSVADDVCSVDMDGSRSVTATFTLEIHQLTINRSGSGTVTSSVGDINCGSACLDGYSHGTSVTLSAEAAEGWIFSSWGGACSGTSDTCNVTVDDAKTVSATFLERFTLTVEKSGSGTVTSSGGGINCGSTCSKVYTDGQSTTLSATPATGWSFAGWLGADCSGTGTCPVTMTEDVTVTATFQRITHLLTVTRTGTGAGTVSSAPGIDCGSDCTEIYDEGTVLTLTAAPSSGSVFTGWSGSCSGTSTSCILTIDAAKAATATFVPSRTLTVVRGGTGAGDVSSDIDGIDCGSACSASYPDGTQVELTAEPDATSTFAGWTNCPSVDGSTCTIEMTANRTITATFTRITHLLTTNRTGNGSGTITSSPAGINCGEDCTESFDSGTAVTLTANPDASSTFVGWSGAGCSGVGSCVVTMSEARSVTAQFTANRLLQVTLAGDGAGSVSSSPAGVACPGDCAETYLDGTSVTLTATPGLISTFTSWAGCDSVAAGECTVSMTSAKSVTATFTKITHLLTVDRDGSGSGSVASAPTGIDCGSDCTQAFDSGTEVTLTATPAGGSVFSGWAGGCSGTGTCLVTMDAAKSVTASFTAMRSLTVARNGTGSGTVSSTPAGIACGSDCEESYLHGTSVTLLATPAVDSTFGSWSGCDSVTGNECTLTMNGSGSVTATFTKITYQLTVTKAGAGDGSIVSSPAGISCGATCQGTFDTGTEVTLTATGDGTSVFTGWSGAGCSGTGTCVVTMDSAKSATASFSPAFTLTVVKSGTGGGTVTSDVPGISCGNDCTQNFLDGETAVLTATPDQNSDFTSWSGCTSVDGTACTVTMSADASPTATFTKRTYLLQVAKNGSGAGTITSAPAGISCGSDCGETFDSGTSVVLTASPSTGSVLDSWTSCPSPSGNQCTLSVTAATTVTATFKMQYTLSVSKSGTGGGTVTSDPSGINCGSDCSEDITDGTAVVLTAAADESSVFSSWTNCPTPSGNQCSLTVTAARAVTAQFTAAHMLTTVITSAGGSGTVTSSPAGINCPTDCTEKYASGTSVTLTATPSAGLVVAWGAGACFGTVGNQCTVSMTQARTVNVGFA